MLIQVLILQHFDLKLHIRISTNTSDNSICEILSELFLNGLSRWKPIAYFLHEMISAKTPYKTHNSEHLGIVKTFKT